MRLLVPLILTLSFAAFFLGAQEEDSSSEESAMAPEALPVGLPVKLDISRRPLKNFLTDETALRPYASGSDSPADFSGAFSLGSPKARYVPIWDPLACRLIAVLYLKTPTTPYRLLAEGSNPTTKAAGSEGAPAYFGMRLDQGRPEFLYTHGSLTVAEMVWLENDGELMKQRFSFRKVSKDIQLVFPENWLTLMTPSVGSFSENVLTVPKEDASEITILYRFNDTTQEASEGKEQP